MSVILRTRERKCLCDGEREQECVSWQDRECVSDRESERESERKRVRETAANQNMMCWLIVPLSKRQFSVKTKNIAKSLNSHCPENNQCRRLKCTLIGHQLINTKFELKRHFFQNLQVQLDAHTFSYYACSKLKNIGIS